MFTDSSFIVTPPLQRKKKACDDLAANQINNTLLSWHSSFNDCKIYIPTIMATLLNYNIVFAARAGLSHNWSYSRTTPPRGSFSPQQQQQPHNASWNSVSNRSVVIGANNSAMTNTNSLMESYPKYKREELITDEESLKQYLK